MRMNFIVALSTVAIAGTAAAAERSLLLKTNEVKDYGKRDRVFFASDQTVAPSQLHEVYGARVDAGFLYDASRSRQVGDISSRTNAPTAAVRGYWGADVATLGLGGAFTNATTNTDNSVDTDETYQSRKLLPAVAFTVAPNFTVGASSDVNWLSLKQTNNGIADQEYDTYIHRESIGASFHTPKLEIGVAYVTPAHERMRTETDVQDTASFALYTEAEPGTRDIYLPAHGTIFARGNLTDHFSMQGVFSQVQYDNNIESSSPTFDKYRAEDRNAGQLQAVYWMRDLGTRVAATASYQGGTFAPYGTEESGLGYRNANLYGGSLDGAVQFGERTYVGLSLGYMRGERNQDLDSGERVVAREERAKIATTINMNM